MTPGRINSVDIPAEILLLIVTLTAVRTFERVFVDMTFLRPLMVTAIVCHVALFITRRLRGGIVLGFLTSLVALVVQITLTHFRDTATWGLPSDRTIDAFSASLRDAFDLFQEVIAPAPVAVGFLVAASFGVWAIAFLADWASFRLRTPGEALLPSVSLFIFISLFAPSEADGRLRHAALYLAACLAFVLAHRAAARVSTGNWLGGNTGRAYGALISGGAILALVAFLGAVTAGPRLPGTDDPPIVDPRDIDGNEPGSRVVISPLIDIRGRIVDQAETEMFSVVTDSPDYWRLTSLDKFNGSVWISEGDYSRAGDSLPVSFPSAAPSELTTQEFTVRNLGLVWLPAAYQPRSLENESELGISYEPDAATLIVQDEPSITDETTLTYRVESEVPKFDPDFLDIQTGTNIDQKYLDLPDGFSQVAQELAAELTAGQSSQYDKALALQNFFRQNFEYDINVLPGHSESAIEQFLDNKVGYCEQFAGTFAAMARSVGLPARVAVGFTKGDQDPLDPNKYTVFGKHGHAWPEVFIDNAGWVRFEPTPGRGAPGSSSYLPDVREAQIGSEDGTSSAESFPNPTPGLLDPTLPENDFDQAIEEPPLPAEDFLDQDAGADSGFDWDLAWKWFQRSLLVLGLPLLYLFGVPAWKTQRRRREVAEAGDDPRKQIGVTWKHTVDRLSYEGVVPSMGETADEFATRAGTTITASAADFQNLGNAVTVATYSPQQLTTRDASEAEAIGTNIRTTLDDRVTITERLKYGLDPRPLFAGRSPSDFRPTFDNYVDQPPVDHNTNPFHWFRVALTRYADFSNRARRREFWSFALVTAGIGALALLFQYFDRDSDGFFGAAWSIAGVITLLTLMALFIPAIAVTVRRLHDIDRSPWLALLLFLPILGQLALAVILAEESTAGTNSYGPSPK